MDEVKRANHNALERKRRVYQKERMQELRQAVPELRHGKPSTVDVLMKSTEYVLLLRNRNEIQEKEIESLRLLNKSLTERLSQALNISESEFPPELQSGLSTEVNTPTYHL